MTSTIQEQHWDAYFAAFGPVSQAERHRLLQSAVADDVIFTNPGGEGKSRDDLAAHIEKFRATMPGAYFETDKTFVHHGELLAVWSMYKQDGMKVATGYNFVRSNPDGRFSYMAGFF